jgi:hypothetical protein
MSIWERVEHWLVFVVAGSLVFMLVAPVTMLLTKHLHRVSRADEKMVALGLGVLFASIGLIFLTRLTRSLEEGESLGVESHWGGLGGGVGGWRVSRPVGYLFCVMTFGALAAVAVSRYPDPPPPESTIGAEITTTTAQTNAGQQKPKTEQQPKPETSPQTKPEAPTQTQEAGQTQPDDASGRTVPPKGQ